MVDMKCEGCVNAVKNKLQTVDGRKFATIELAPNWLNTLIHFLLLLLLTFVWGKCIRSQGC